MPCDALGQISQACELLRVDGYAGGSLLIRLVSKWGKLSVILVQALCAGCALMPASGPLSTDVRSAQSEEPNSLPYALIKVTPDVVRTLSRFAPRLSSAFANRTPPKAFRFGIGDSVSVTVFEAASGGLFIPAEAGARSGNFVVIPNQTVDDEGDI